MDGERTERTERTVQGITWTDDLAWMEPMKGDQWESFLHKSQDIWKSAVASSHGIPRIRNQIKKATAVGRQMRFSASEGSVEIGHIGTMAYCWRWKGEHEVRQVSDICVKGDCVYVSYEDDTVSGAENYVIAAYKSGSKVPLWEKKGMSPYVGVLGDRCYSIEAKNKLVYYKVVSWLAETGKGLRSEYEEKDFRYNLELIRGRDCLFLRRQSGPKQDVFQISERAATASIAFALESISLESRRFVFGCVGADEYIYWNKGWSVSKGLLKQGYMFPSFHKASPEYIDTKRNLLITRWYGKRTLWKLSDGEPRILWKGVGNLMIDPWESNWMRITVPGVKIAWHLLGSGLGSGSGSGLSQKTQGVREHFVKSADGTEVPFYMVGPKGKSSGLFIAAYSAYGIPSSFSTARWVPLLAAGWTICFPLYRGGGDHTPEWEDAGRLRGRLRVLEDAEAVVKEARSICDIPASSTVLYGRSAGGLWVGGLCSRYPNGDLFGGAYMEVPYLDVLRTTTNHSLPLTFLETDEFGLPAMRLSDFEGMMKWSPMETLPPGGLRIAQIVRTGLNDSQVFAYESAKWMMRSSGLSHGQNQSPRQLLAIQGGQGHFVNGSVGLQQQAEDIAVLMSLIKNRSNQYKMANRKNMRKGTRKNRRNNRKGTRKNMRK
jgi:hypothetical protein